MVYTTLIEFFIKKDVDFDIPPYHRNFVWEKSQMYKAIEIFYFTLENGNKDFFSGNIVVQKDKYAEHGEIYFLIDGYQRIFTFFAMYLAFLKANLNLGTIKEIKKYEKYLNVMDSKFINSSLYTTDSKFYKDNIRDVIREYGLTKYMEGWIEKYGPMYVIKAFESFKFLFMDLENVKVETETSSIGGIGSSFYSFYNTYVPKRISTFSFIKDYLWSKKNKEDIPYKQYVSDTSKMQKHLYNLTHNGKVNEIERVFKSILSTMKYIYKDLFIDAETGLEHSNISYIHMFFGDKGYDETYKTILEWVETYEDLFYLNGIESEKILKGNFYLAFPSLARDNFYFLDTLLLYLRIAKVHDHLGTYYYKRIIKFIIIYVLKMRLLFKLYDSKNEFINKLTNFVPSLLDKVSDYLKDYNEGLITKEELIHKGTEDLRNNTVDNALNAYLRDDTEIIFNNKNASIIRIILWMEMLMEMEDYEKEIHLNDWMNFNVEHIVPQRQEGFDIVPSFKINNLGNLVIIEKEINSEMNNAQWKDKRAYFEKSKNPVARKLAENEVFSTKQIEERHKKLVNFLKIIIDYDNEIVTVGDLKKKYDELGLNENIQNKKVKN